MFVGEAPGAGEDDTGLPFQGRAGKYLDYLLASISLPRDQCLISNTVKCRPSNNRDPNPEEIATCGALWLDTEIQLANPPLIVALGLISSRYLTGDYDLTLEKDHGIPHTINGRTILPVYHPAAGLHQSRLMRFVQEDFDVIRRLVHGEQIPVPTDPYPRPDYRTVTTERDARACLAKPLYALDTETITGSDGRSRLWSIQISDREGSGWFIPRSALSGSSDEWIPPTSTVIVHNYLYDAQFLAIPNPIDTMVAAYLLQLPMGLKELAYRYCGMEMASYDEYVRPYRRQKAIDYLALAASYIREERVPANPKAKNPKKYKTIYTGWQSPPDIADWEWDNSRGELIWKSKNPHWIGRKILDRLVKSYTEPDFDPYQSWLDIDSRERQVVEDVLGPMVDAGLQDAPLDQAVYYSCRDADATWRLWMVLEPMLRDRGLMEVFEMEMGR